MTTSGAAELLRGPGDPQRATFLELFFDLAFVFALAQLSHELIDDLTWIGVLQTLVLLLAIWQIWFSTAATTDRRHVTMRLPSSWTPTQWWCGW